MKTSVGVIGQGFVGSAIREGLSAYYNILTYDIKSELCNCSSMFDVIEKSEITFVCLPTPMKKDGSCYLGIVEETVLKIDDYCVNNNIENKILVLKSTIPPGTTKSISEKCKNVTLVFSPEFLTEANSFDDFKNQTRIIIGGPRPASSKVKTMFRKAFPTTPIVKTDSTHAEAVKYFINCFLSLKVSFSNEMFQLCNSIGIDYDKIVEYSLYDNRLGKSHFSVPGPDGHLGFGGHCFPKDLAALIKVMGDNDIDCKMLLATQQKNNEVRDVRDWELMSGRAVIDE